MSENDFKDAMWYTAIGTFGLGDIITTKVGMDTMGVVEAHPVSEAVLDTSGAGGMVAVKSAVFTGAAIAYGLSPDEYNVGIPIGLSLLGTLIVINNARVIMKANGVM